MAEVEKEGLSRKAVLEYVELMHFGLEVSVELWRITEQQEANDGKH